jgi:hypothetical protein
LPWRQSGISITPQSTFANDVHMIGYAEATCALPANDD